MDIEETSTPTDFLDHEPSKHEKMEVSFGEFFGTEGLSFSLLWNGIPSTWNLYRNLRSDMSRRNRRCLVVEFLLGSNPSSHTMIPTTTSTTSSFSSYPYIFFL